jgi:hypothetical protein
MAMRKPLPRPNSNRKRVNRLFCSRPRMPPTKEMRIVVSASPWKFAEWPFGFQTELSLFNRIDIGPAAFVWLPVMNFPRNNRRFLHMGSLAFLLLGITSAAYAKLTLTGVTVYGATDSRGSFMGSYNYWDTRGQNEGYNVFLFTGSTKSPNFLNTGDTDETLDPEVNLVPGKTTIEFAVDIQDTDPALRSLASTCILTRTTLLIESVL